MKVVSHFEKNGGHLVGTSAGAQWTSRVRDLALPRDTAESSYLDSVDIQHEKFYWCCHCFAQYNPCWRYHLLHFGKFYILFGVGLHICALVCTNLWSLGFLVSKLQQKGYS